VQEINRKLPLDILRTRRRSSDKIRENRRYSTAQCAAIEDVLKLIRDQSVNIRDPSSLDVQLENIGSRCRDYRGDGFRPGGSVIPVGRDLWNT